MELSDITSELPKALLESWEAYDEMVEASQEFWAGTISYARYMMLKHTSHRAEERKRSLFDKARALNEKAHLARRKEMLGY
jgi:hypothetical protein